MAGWDRYVSLAGAYYLLQIRVLMELLHL